MHELDQIAVVGAGRLGTALSDALRTAGFTVAGPLRRGEPMPPATGTVLLCVPDRAIGEAADAVPRGPLVGHCSGATTLEPLHDHHAFSMHPLMTIPANRPTTFTGVMAAVAGHPVGSELARRLGMVPVVVSDADRAAYHASACIASNFLVTLECAAERLAGTAGISREQLVPLVRATVDNWAALGVDALTGPIARGDEATVARHRAALRERTPDLLALYDVLAEVTAR